MRSQAPRDTGKELRHRSSSGWRRAGLTLGIGLLSLCGAFALGVANAAPAPDGRGVLLVEQPEIKDIKTEVIILHATNDKSGIDPKIGKMPELEKPPFSTYNSYKLLEKAELKLTKGELKEQKLPDGGKLKVTFKEVVKSKKKDDPSKFSLATSIEKSDGKEFANIAVSALQGNYFFIAGQKYKEGVLVIGIKVK